MKESDNQETLDKKEVTLDNVRKDIDQNTKQANTDVKIEQKRNNNWLYICFFIIVVSIIPKVLYFDRIESPSGSEVK